jgi:hypothetical protein
MAEKFSRRAMVRGAVGTALATAAVPLTFAHDPKQTDDAGLDRRLDEAEKKLTKPLDPEVKKTARRMLKGLDTESVDRMKTKLPENSAPCFTYVATPYTPAKLPNSGRERVEEQN